MHCLTLPVNNNQILINVTANAHESPEADGVKPLHEADQFRALVDTGAMRSCITPNVADALDVQPIDKQKVYTAGGPVYQNVYVIDVHVHIDTEVKTFSGMEVFETAATPLRRYDILLGMDVIMQGELHVVGGQFTFCV